MIIHFDICALFIIMMVMFSMHYRHMLYGTANKIFMVLLFSSVIAAATDIISLDTNLGDNGMTVVAAIYYISRNFIAPCYVVYLIALTDGWRIVKGTFIKVAGCVPYLTLVVLVAVVNPFTHAVYSVENGVYSRGPLMPALYVLSLCYLAAAICYIMLYRNFFKRDKFYSLLAIVPMTLVAVAIQFFVPNLLIELFTQSACLTFYSIMVQSPDERFSADLRISNREAFIEDMRLAQFNRKKSALCLFKVKNYAARIELVSYESGRVLTENIANRVVGVLRKENIRATAYHFELGSFGVLIDEKDRERALSLADKISAALADDRVRKDIVNTKLEFYECVVNFPEDVPDYNMLQSLLEGYHKFLPSTDKVYQIAEIGNDNELKLYLDLDSTINRAVEGHKFEVWYQPIYSVEENRFASAEALIRLSDPDYGYIDPEMLITHAEETGDIHRIGLIVFEEVCKFISSAEFSQVGLDFVEINLSVEQFRDSRLAEKLIQMASFYGIDSSRINFEITETAVAETWEEVVSQVQTLADAGFGFALDDYGQKNSNLKRLSSLPLSIVKLDREIVAGMDSIKGLKILEDSVEMLHKMGKKITAEGIESSKMAVRMADMGCDYLQGYVYSKAIPYDKFMRFMRGVYD